MLTGFTAVLGKFGLSVACAKYEDFGGSSSEARVMKDLGALRSS